MADKTSEDDKKLERNVFLFLAVFLAPLVAVAITAGTGFTIWISQMLFGLPGN